MRCRQQLVREPERQYRQRTDRERGAERELQQRRAEDEEQRREQSRATSAAGEGIHAGGMVVVRERYEGDLAEARGGTREHDPEQFERNGFEPRDHVEGKEERGHDDVHAVTSGELALGDGEPNSLGADLVEIQRRRGLDHQRGQDVCEQHYADWDYGPLFAAQQNIFCRAGAAEELIADN